MVSNNKNINYYSTQDSVNVDIDDLYNKIIKQIDFFRSHCYALIPKLNNALSVSSIDDILSDSDVITTAYQESRCSAFYRMVGFPVVDKDLKFYSPGFDPTLNRNEDLLENNIKIANNMAPNLKTILNQREAIFVKNKNLLAKQDINSISASIASIYVRPFDLQIKNPDKPFDIDFKDQVFKISNRTLIKTTYFQDLSNDITFPIDQSVHPIAPFMADPRIDFTVMPTKNRITVPFPLDAADTRINGGSNQINLKRPYIEKVITTRLNNRNVFNDSTIDQSVQSNLDSVLSDIQELSAIKDPKFDDIKSNIAKNLYGSEVFTLTKYLNMMTDIIDILCKSIELINNTRNKINWMPVPSDRYGLEQDITNKEPTIADDLRNSQIDRDIIELTNKKIVHEFNLVGNTDTDVGGFAFSNLDDIVLGDFKSTTSYFDNQIDSLNNQRKNLYKKANDALRTVEIITGEFSGLGLIDILAIQAALWSISIESLVGLIDKRAFDRMSNIPYLQQAVQSTARNDITTSMQEFGRKLSDIYTLLQKQFNGEIAYFSTNS